MVTMTLLGVIQSYLYIHISMHITQQYEMNERTWSAYGRVYNSRTRERERHTQKERMRTVKKEGQTGAIINSFSFSCSFSCVFFLLLLLLCSPIHIHTLSFLLGQITIDNDDYLSEHLISHLFKVAEKLCIIINNRSKSIVSIKSIVISLPFFLYYKTTLKKIWLYVE